jgi:hypothetical protein
MHPSLGAHFKYARCSMPTAVLASMCRRFLISVSTENIGGFRTDRGHSCNGEVHGWFIATVTHVFVAVFCCTASDCLVVHVQCMGTHSRNLHIMHSLHARNVTYLNMGSLLRFCPSFSFFILSLFETISKQSAPRQQGQLHNVHFQHRYGTSHYNAQYCSMGSDHFRREKPKPYCMEGQ